MPKRSSRSKARTSRRRPGEVRVAALDRRRSGRGGPGRGPEEPGGGGGAYLVAGAALLLAWVAVAFNVGF
jgi:hypothetical protein